MADKSWGLPSAPAALPETRAAGGDRLSRLEARAAEREASAQAREQARDQRRAEIAELGAKDPHAAAAQRRRVSGRKDVVREQRDTRSYAVVVDEGRIRTLAQRGASVAGLAAVFGLPAAEIERVLNTPD